MTKHFREKGHRWGIYDGETLVGLGLPWNISSIDTSLYRTKAEAMEHLRGFREVLPKGSRVVKVVVKYEIS